MVMDIPFIPVEWQPMLYDVLIITITVIVALLVDRLILSRLKTIAKRLDISIDVIKGIQLFFRFIILIVVIMVISSTQNIPSTYVISVGALAGTAIGFGITRAMSNFISGAYVLISGLVRIGDYVNIGGVEGEVVNLTINYTKIRRSDGSYYIISNSEVLNKSIISYKIDTGEKEFFIYPISITLSSSVEIEKVQTVFEKIKKEVENEVIKISMTINKITRLEYEFLITVEVDDAEKIPNLKTKILEKFAEELGKTGG